MGNPNAPATSARPAVAALAVLGAVALLGNGMKAIVTSTVLVSEATFASFLGIPVARVALLMEAIVGGMVVALAAYPLLLRRWSPSAIGVGACAVAAAAFAAFGLVDLDRPGAAPRELAAYACLTLGAAAVACLAPTAQALVARWPEPGARKALTTVWTGAAPAGFLAAPQLVALLLPAFGLAWYFLAFAALPLALLALLLGFAALVPDTARDAGDRVPLPAELLTAFVAAVVAFEAWSTLGSISGYAAPATLAALPVLVAAGAWFARSAVRVAGATTLPAGSAWLLGALFALQWPTTGFFEAAFLYRQDFATSFVADRSTLAAAAQIAGTIAAGALAHRRPAREAALQLAFAGATIAGLAMFALYPWLASRAWYLWTPVLTGFGSGGLTVLLCLALVRDAVRVPLLAALPAIAIMVGTEVGLELLELVLATAQAAGLAPTDAFAVLFAAQLALALAVPALLVTAGSRIRARQAPPPAAPATGAEPPPPASAART